MNDVNESYPRGTVEFISGTVTANVNLDPQVVEIALSRGGSRTWLPAEWTGTVGTTRSARTVEPVELGDDYPADTYSVFVRVTDSPEVPVMRAGTVTID